MPKPPATSGSPLGTPPPRSQMMQQRRTEAIFKPERGQWRPTGEVRPSAPSLGDARTCRGRWGSDRGKVGVRILLCLQPDPDKAQLLSHGGLSICLTYPTPLVMQEMSKYYQSIKMLRLLNTPPPPSLTRRALGSFSLNKNQTHFTN